jgi:hypothetical protein
MDKDAISRVALISPTCSVKHSVHYSVRRNFFVNNLRFYRLQFYNIANVIWIYVKKILGFEECLVFNTLYYVE